MIQPKLTLVTLGGAFGLQNVSPFCLKAEMLMTQLGLDYDMEVQADPRKAPDDGFGPPAPPREDVLLADLGVEAGLLRAVRERIHNFRVPLRLDDADARARPIQVLEGHLGDGVGVLHARERPSPRERFEEAVRRGEEQGQRGEQPSHV